MFSEFNFHVKKKPLYIRYLEINEVADENQLYKSKVALDTVQHVALVVGGTIRNRHICGEDRMEAIIA